MTNDQDNARYDNPLLKRLSSAQFQASVQFYEADRQLTLDDRVQLAEDMRIITPKIGGASFLLGLAGFFSWTVYRRFGGAAGAGAGAGAAGPRSTFPRPFGPRFIHRPFRSFMTALVCMVIGNQVAGRYQFNKQMTKLESDPYKQRQLNVWKHIDRRQLPLFSLYYIKSSQDPSYILQDPRTYTEKQMHQVHYRQPYQGKGVFRKDDDRKVDEDGKMTHWEQIRVSNGFGPKPEDNRVQSSESQSESPSEGQSGESSESDSPAGTSGSSAWDRVRRGKSGEN